MPRFSFSSLRARLLLLVFLAVIPALGLIIYTAAEMRRSASGEAQTNALRLAQSVANSQDDLIEGARQLLIALAQLPEVRKQDSEACNALFARLLKQIPLYVSLGAVDVEGNPFCSAIPISKSFNVADRTYFQGAVQYRDFAVGDYTIGRVSGKASLNFGYPVLDDNGTVQAVVLAALDLAWLNKLVAKAQLPPGATLTVIDRKGIILVRHPDPDKWVGKSMPETPLVKTILSRGAGTSEAAGMDGVPRLYGFSPLGDTGGAYVSVGVPKDIASAAANRILARNLVTLGIVCMLAFMAAWFGADLFVLRRVNDLVSTTKRLTAGDLRARTEIPYGKGELSKLACTFDEMAGSMERLVTERKQVEGEIQRQMQRITVLREINLATTSTLNLRNILAILLEKMDLCLPYATATTVRLFDEESGRLEPLASRNIDEQEWRAEPWRGGRGIQRLVFESKAPQTIRNIETDPRVQNLEFYRKHKLISYLGVPLIAKDKVLGVLSLYTKEEHKFSDEEVEILSTLANQAAIAIQNSRLYEKELASRKELDAANQRLSRLLRENAGLYAALSPLVSADSLTHMLEKIVERLREATSASAALIRLQHSIPGTYPLVTQRGFPEYYLKAVVREPPSGAAAWVFENVQPMIAPDIAAEPRLKGKVALQAGLRSIAMLPLTVQNQVRGVIVLASPELGFFNEGQKDHLMAVARQMGIALENRELFEKVAAANDALEKVNDDLKKREEIEKLLKELNQDITSLDLDSLLKKLTEKICALLKVDVADVRILEEKKWHVRGLSGMVPGTVPGLRTGTSRGRSGWIVKNRRPLVIPDITRSEGIPKGQTIEAQGIRGYLGVPIFSSDGEVIGILRVLTYQPREFLREEVELCQQIANGAAIALENARLWERVKSQALELEKANKAKDEFLGFVSHELKTPVNAVMGYAAMIQDGLLGKINPEQEEAMEKMLVYSKELRSMIDSLLEVTRIEAGGVEIESHKVNLGRFLGDLKAAYDVPMGNQITLEWDYPSDLPTVITDTGKLVHILQNLINNAIKFTEKGSVKISARCRPETEHIEFKVADTGIGIPQDSLPLIFEMFRQVNGSHGKPSGSVGLGLHIVKKFTELLGGKISVESEVGRGSTFTVTIPYERQESGERQQA